MMNDATKPGDKRIEIAYTTFGRDDRMVCKRKVVSAKALERTLKQLDEAGAMNIMTRDADG
jgi:hypothetical protein